METTDIQTVKETPEGGYFINGIHTVGYAPGNRHYQLVQDWIAEGNTPDPWETDSEKLSRVRKERLEEVKKTRQEMISRGYTFEGNTYDTDEKSVQNINGAVTAALISQQQGNPFSIEWTLKDNSSVTLDGTQMITLGMEVVSWVDAHHAASRAHKDNINALTTSADIEAYDLSADWPEEVV